MTRYSPVPSHDRLTERARIMHLFLSPHLDDAIFSCGGLIAQLAPERVRVVTCFTQSVLQPQGFALACQTDKGLAADVDYMALRREEDRQACAHLGAECEWWDVAEAPHRGYDSAAKLFAELLPTDEATITELENRLRHLLGRTYAQTVYYPYGAGDHVDHRLLIAAVARVKTDWPRVRWVQYYDQPYTNKFAHRYPDIDTAPPQSLDTLRRALAPGVHRLPLPESAQDRKFRASAAYATQVGFQFGGPHRIGKVLRGSEWYVAH